MKIINNKLGEDIFLPAINRQVLILGHSAKFWQVFFVCLVPTFLLGYGLDLVWIFLGIYFFLGFIFVYFGDQNTKQLEKGKYFYAQEKKAFYQKKGARIVMGGVKEYDLPSARAAPFEKK